jgi:hypothetical protein
MLTRRNLCGFLSFCDADSAVLQRHLLLRAVQGMITARPARCTYMPYSSWPSVTISHFTLRLSRRLESVVRCSH